ncbi:hypothetical protein K492DRAFT_139113, partial [Lichtheimia hyalospora FSU 10163]
MRLINIEDGKLEIKNNNTNLEYVAISHRWLENEINLLNLGVKDAPKKLSIGEFLFKDLLKNDNIKIKLESYKNICKSYWELYLNIENIIDINYLDKYLKNHYKLIKLINRIKKYKDKYIWIDTLCIDKTSSSELNENIISMYNIYKCSKYVFVYLNSYYISIKEIFRDEWFTRCWTLQEYLANYNLYVHNNLGDFVCTKNDIWSYIEKTDNINIRT